MLEEAMRRKNRAQVRRASMTYAERVERRKRAARNRAVMRAFFFVGGLMCGVESLAEIMFLVFFGVIGPIGLHYDVF